MLTILVALALEAAAPSAEAVDLGRRLAATGTLATLAPMLIEKDLGELAKESPLTPAEQARLIEIGRGQGKAAIDRMVGAFGQAYAAKLSIEDLHELVAHAESPSERRLRAIQPAAIAEAMKTLGEIDIKTVSAAAFCKETGKLCNRK